MSSSIRAVAIGSRAEQGSSIKITSGSTAMARASDRIIQQGKETAAGMFECAVADVSFERGWFQVQGTDLRAGLFAVAARAREQDASLDTLFESSNV